MAARLGLGRNTAYRLAAAGKLPVPVIRAGGTLVDGRVVGGRLFVSKAELAKLLGEQPEQGGQPGGAR